MNFEKENIMSAAITASSPFLNASEKFNVAAEQPLGVDRLTLAPAAIDRVSAFLATNLAPTVASTPGTDLSSLFSAPDDYMNKALDLLKPGPNGEPPSQQNILN